MKYDEFVRKMREPTVPMTEKELNNILERSLSPETPDKFKGFNNLIIEIEEFAEITKEATKYLRGKSNPMCLLEELADAQLAIRYIQKICNISDESLQKAMHIKMQRVDETLKNHLQFQ